MSTDTQSATMTEGRGLLTETEREAIAGERSDSYRYKTRSYYRNRLGEVEKDVQVLAEHAPELLEKLQDVVCETPPDREPRERHEAGGAPPTDVSPTDGEATREAADVGRDGERERAEQRIRELADVLEGDENSFEIRVEAVLAIYDHLRDTDGKKRKGDLEDYVDDVGVDTGYASFGSLWSNWVKANTDTDRPNLLEELPGVERRGNYYTYTGGDDE